MRSDVCGVLENDVCNEVDENVCIVSDELKELDFASAALECLGILHGELSQSSLAFKRDLRLVKVQELKQTSILDHFRSK